MTEEIDELKEQISAQNEIIDELNKELKTTIGTKGFYEGRSAVLTEVVKSDQHVIDSLMKIITELSNGKQG
jgi:endonuclease III-like uncharacterized protein